MGSELERNNMLVQSQCLEICNFRCCISFVLHRISPGAPCSCSAPANKQQCASTSSNNISILVCSLVYLPSGVLATSTTHAQVALLHAIDLFYGAFDLFYGSIRKLHPYFGVTLAFHHGTASFSMAFQGPAYLPITMGFLLQNLKYFFFHLLLSIPSLNMALIPSPLLLPVSVPWPAIQRLFASFSLHRSGYFNKDLEEYVEIPSDSGITFNQNPKMKALEIAEKMRDVILSGKFDQVRVNLPNGDMVGHTGDLRATIVGCEAADEAVKNSTTAIYS
eukprot:Gb_01539 [translate_table: standard]